MKSRLIRKLSAIWAFTYWLIAFKFLAKLRTVDFKQMDQKFNYRYADMFAAQYLGGGFTTERCEPLGQDIRI